MATTTSKMIAARALHNTLLKDQSMYCNSCGDSYVPELMPCCDTPEIGKHIDFCVAVAKQNKELRESRSNGLASTKDKSMRWGLSIPPVFFKELCDSFKNMYGEKLLATKQDFRGFLKHFKEYRICERV